jgi:selenocysteine-specific translation elongation factor
LSGAKANLKALQEKFPKVQILPVSAAKGEGIDNLKQALATQITEIDGSVAAAI